MRKPNNTANTKVPVDRRRGTPAFFFILDTRCYATGETLKLKEISPLWLNPTRWLYTIRTNVQLIRCTAPPPDLLAYVNAVDTVLEEFEANIEVLAEYREVNAEFAAENAKLKADVKRLRLILACVEPDIKRLPNCEERDCHPDCLVRQLFETLAATEPNGTGAGAPDAAKAVGPQRLGPASANDTKGKP